MLNKIKEKYPTIISILVIAIISFFVSLMMSNHPWRSGPTDVDSSVFVYIANLILDGKTPYVDTFDHKGPVLYLINIFARLISPDLGLWLIELVALFVAFYFIYKTAMVGNNSHIVGLFSTIVASAVTLRFFCFGNLPEDLALPFISAALFIFVEYFHHNKINKFRLIACGFCFCVVFLMKFNLIGLWVVMCIGVLIKSIINKDFKQLLYFLKYFLLGCFICAIPILIWLASCGAVGAFIKSYFIFNFSYGSSNSAEILLKTQSVWHTVLYYHQFLFVILLEISAIIAIIEKRTWLTCLNVFLIAFNMYAIITPCNLFYHYLIYMTPIVGFNVSLFLSCFKRNFKLISKEKAEEKITNRSQTIKLLVRNIILFIVVVAMFLSSYFAWNMQIRADAFFGEKDTYPTVEWIKVIDTISSECNDSDTLIVCGNSNYIYTATGLPAISKYSYQYPIGCISEDIAKEFCQDLEAARPTFIVIQLEQCIEKEFIFNYIKSNDYVKIYESAEDAEMTFFVYKLPA